MPKAKPIILLATTERWYPTARLGVALAKAGCAVEAVCPPDHPIARTSAVRRIHEYDGLMPLRSLRKAIVDSQPDFVVPGDDLATRQLHELWGHEQSQGDGNGIGKLIERSLGKSTEFPVLFSRARFMKVAGDAGVRVPRTEVIETLRDLHSWIERVGLPTVLKANGTSGGDGVRVVHNVKEAEAAFRKLQTPPLLARAVKRAIVDRDKTLLRPSLLRQRRTVNAQEFVAGCEATSAVVCLDGRVLAGLHFEVLSKVRDTGHATVVRRIRSAEMAAAIDKIAARLKLSGLHGFDFMLESETGRAFLIEINPRATQVGHLSLGVGRDLPAALYKAVVGEYLHAPEPVTENEAIALFPQEWLRDPSSEFLRSAYHDVPWSEPALVEDCVRKLRPQESRRLQQTPVPAVSTVSPTRAYAARVVD
ncbi:MAG TPA: ATP-grasp domain-containing protein [Terriglobales bacterium]|nr:ATP-grasp domain-containing protein [Terriglobales bacterium]